LRTFLKSTFWALFLKVLCELFLDRWAFETGTLRGVAPQFVPSNDSAAGGQRAFKMPVGLKVLFDILFPKKYAR